MVQVTGKKNLNTGEVETEMRLMREEEGEDIKSRRELERRVEELENKVMEVVERNRGKGKWKYGKKVWWNGEIEKVYGEVRGMERRWEESGRRIGGEEVKEGRKRWKKKVEEVKREHWLRYLEGIKERDGYKWVKTDRDLLVDIPSIGMRMGEWLKRMVKRRRK